MMQDKIKPELSGQPSTRMFGMFSTFHLLGPMGRWAACIVFSVAVLLTFTTWYFVRGEVIKRAQTRFNFRVTTIVETGISERLQAYEFLLQGGSGLFSISNEVTRKDWRAYVNSLQIDQYYPGLQGVGFAKQILPSEKEAHIRQIRGEGFPQYTIYPDGERPEYTSIIFLEPFDWRNQRAFGYDMFSQATRKEAMIRARDTGKVALSGKVTLVQETDKDIQAGFLIYQAIYRKGEPQETPEQRRKALLGYVYSPFRMNDFMKGILAEKEGYVDLQIFDGDKPLKETLLYQSDSAEEPYNHPEGRHFVANQIILDSANHNWLLSFVASKYFEENISSVGSNFILVLGLIISLLLFNIVLFLFKSHSQAIALAITTTELRNLALYLQNVIEKERTMVAREIHDELGQVLTALKMDVSWLGDKIKDRKLVEKSLRIMEDIDQAIIAVQRISTELRPGILDHLGLFSAVEWQIEEFRKRTGINCELIIENEDIRIDPDSSTVVFRILQEALTNIIRHAEAKKVIVRLDRVNERLNLEVIDNGIGMDINKESMLSTYGLTGIRERVRALNGKTSIESTPGKGTTIQISIPDKQRELKS